MVVDGCLVYKNSSKVPHYLADNRQKIDNVFNTLWLEKPPSALTTTTTNFELTLNGC